MKHTSLLISLTLIGLALMSFACAEDMSLNKSQKNTFEVNESFVESMNLNNRFKNPVEIFTHTGHLRRQQASHSGCSIKREINDGWLWEGATHLIVAEFTGNSVFTPCHLSESGLKVSKGTFKVEYLIGKNKISRILDINLGSFAVLDKPGERYLISLAKHEEEYYLVKYLSIAENKEDAQTSNIACASSKVSSDIYELQSIFNLKGPDKVPDYIQRRDEIECIELQTQEGREE